MVWTSSSIENTRFEANYIIRGFFSRIRKLTNLELIEKISKEQEQLHPRQSFTNTLSFTHRERYNLVDLHKTAIVSQMSLRIELIWFREDLRGR